MAQRYRINLDAVFKLTELERAWIAGFFDGEGSVTMHWREESKNVLVHIAVSQNRPAVIKWLHDLFGGTFFVEKPTQRSPRPHYKWAIRGHEECRIFIQLVRPYLRVKGDEMDEALTVLTNRHTMTAQQMEHHKDNIRRFRTA